MVIHSFKHHGAVNQPQGATTQKTCFLNTDTGLQLIKSFSRNLVIKLAIYFTAVLTLPHLSFFK